VAVINLMSPVSVDANNPVASDTFDERLDLIIEDLKAFKPDLVGFNEATWTAAHGAAVERLAKGLKMEWQYGRSNPWFPGQTKEASDETAKQIGLDEGDCILSRYPILWAKRESLNPRTSETEGRAALHVVVKGPGSLGEIDVYIAHLTGGGEQVRKAQATDFVNIIKTTRGKGPLLVMGDMSEPVDSATHRVYQEAGLKDLVADPALMTCCRENVVGEQAALTTRTDYLLSDAWMAGAVGLLADAPKKRADGTLLYASDHNGLTAVFSLKAPASAPRGAN
jgi:endonuclease/exonuclease/phosphatase family metal-dependent hydrolase